ncbi:uncharacterized protein LOC124300312 [Neodiprion virginianus]|uniref:uncharacterized protein LOC124300312 n=1 Tax=Neodiprion virginianus TaxID=2961670 RepID=UPI001EE69E54|nr:uncharacterized protein LOC124300312 [Neodiprion virginianus]XP_046610219.1 uncharacterized protein LOC124300312 [Neodiprion virginianus]
MEIDHGLRNTSILSKSYMRGIERITGNQNKQRDAFEIPEVIQARKEEWAMLFEKFSQVSDDLELYIRTLNADAESSGSCEYRVPVRKSAAEVQYWVDTGNPPCQAFEALASDSDVTISISESEGAGLDESQLSTSTSLVVTKQFASSREQLFGTCSSGSSVDTTAYILSNANMTRKANLPFDKDPRIANITNTNNNRIGRFVSNRIPKVVLTRLTGIPKQTSNSDNNAILQKNIALDLNCISKRESFENDKISAMGDMSLAERIGTIDKRCNSDEHKDSEVTLESKKSAVDSLPIESEKADEKNNSGISFHSSNVIVTVSQKRKSNWRKLYSVNRDVCDELTPMIKHCQDSRSGRKSIHPALVDSSSTRRPRKSVFRPQLSTLTRRSKIRRFKNRSINTSSAKNKLKKKSSLIKSRDAEDSQGLHRDSPDSMVMKRNDEIYLGQEKTIDSPTKETLLEASPILHTKSNKVMKSDDPAAASSSLSLQDVSEIINEEMNRIQETHNSVAGKHFLKQSFPTGSQQFENRHKEDDQGSVFRPPADSLSELMDSRRQNIFDAKKNLYATDLKSCSDTNSPLASSPSKIQVAEDNGSEASTSLLHSFKQKIKRQSISSPTKVKATNICLGSEITVRKPIIILHDFLHLKNCCGELEKQHNKKWLSKQHQNENLHTVEKDMDEKNSLQDNSVQEDNVNFKFTQSLNHRDSEMNKAKLNKKLTSLKSNNDILTKNIDLVIDNPRLSDQKLSPLKTHEPIEDIHCASTTGISCRPEAATSIQLSKDRKATVKTTNRNCNSQDSLFHLISSDEEDILETLTRRLKSRSSRKTRSVRETGGTELIDRGENRTVQTPKKSQGAELNSARYKIVSSSSEDETNIMNGRGLQHKKIASSRTFTKLSSKKNKGKSSPKSEQTTSPVQDECVNKADSFQSDDQELDRQSLDVNKHFEMKKGNPANNQIHNYNESHERMDENIPKSKLPISHKTDNTRTTVLMSRTKENFTEKNSKHSITPIDLALNDRSKLRKNISKSNVSSEDERRIYTREHRDAVGVVKKLGNTRLKKKRKSNSQIDDNTSADSVRTEGELELGRVQNYKNRRKSFCEMDKVDEAIDGNLATSNGCERFLIISSDESFKNDDPTISRFMNCAGTNSQRKENENNDESYNSNSLKDSMSPTKQGLVYEKDTRSSLKKISVTGQKKSKIIFCTKEYWESDSDYS